VLWLDAYERRARLAPGLLALLPIMVVVAALGVRQAPVVTSFVALLSAAGGPVLLATYVRWTGLRAQDRLWSAWGGAPTTIALRHRNRPTNPVQQELWRRAVAEVTQVQLLDEEAERIDPEAADRAIEVAVTGLRGQTRGEEFALLFAENKNYGFQRNLYGVRHAGRLSAVVSCLALSSVLAYQLKNNGLTSVPIDLVLGLCATLCLLTFWIIGPSSRHVRVAGGKYAEQLFQAATALERGRPTIPEQGTPRGTHERH
jgi:hypothetical protein